MPVFASEDDQQPPAGERPALIYEPGQVGGRRNSDTFTAIRNCCSRREEDLMLNFSDLFQWERFITPSIIKLFYWLALGITVLFGLSGVFAALGTMVVSPGVGFVMLIGSLLGVVVGVIFARIAAEFILIVFRINEHLGAIRNRGDF
jgi:hypothetical protein